MTFRLSFWLELAPSLFQLARTSTMFLGIAQPIPLKLRNIFHNREVPLLCKEKDVEQSPTPLQKKHLEQKGYPL